MYGAPTFNGWWVVGGIVAIWVVLIVYALAKAFL